MSIRELRILQPAATKPEELEELKENRPFLMRGTLPVEAEFQSLISIPTIVDMIGFSGGNGPPAFSYIVDPDQKDVEHYLWFLVGPNLPVGLPGNFDVRYTFRGVVQTLGMLMGGLEVKSCRKNEIDTMQEGLQEMGSMVFEMVPYKIPDLVRQRAFPHAPRKPSV